METFLSVLLYVLTGIGVLMVISFWVSDIYLDGKRFRWCYVLAKEPAGLKLYLRRESIWFFLSIIFHAKHYMLN